jgi:VanZ family protein
VIRPNPRIWAVFGWIGVIFYSSTSLAGEQSERAFSYLSGVLLPQFRTSTPSYGVIHFLADKGLHIFLFCVLGMLLWKVVPDKGKKIPLIILLGAIVGSCSEFLQSFFPGRDPAVSDVLINTAGTGIGVAVRIFIAKVRARAAPTLTRCNPSAY